MVAGEVFFAFGGHRALSKIIGKPFEKLFCISGSGAGAFILGAVCGLPLGGKYALSLYECGDISKEECERLIGICNNAGVGFVVMGIGFSLWENTSFGWLIYAVQIFSAIIAGALLSSGCKRKEKSISIAPVTQENNDPSFFSVFSSAVASSAINMLKLCGFVVFFGAVCEFMRHGAQALDLPALFSVTLSAFTEITFAAAQAHEFFLTGSYASLHGAKILTFFAIGFSGLSAHMQLSAFASRQEICMRKYYLTKLLCGLICALTGAIILHYFSF